jgi:hypothetical protein
VAAAAYSHAAHTDLVGPVAEDVERPGATVHTSLEGEVAAAAA